MKFLLTTLLALFTTLVVAAPGNMSEEQMQKMMQDAQAAQACFENIDPSAFEALETRGKQMEAEIKALCAEGKRDEAMKSAMKYGMEINSDPNMQEIRKCSKIMEGAMGGMMPQPYMPPDPEDDKDVDICDGM